MNTNFSEQLWIDFDLEVEYFLRFLVTWITYNSQKDKSEDRNFHDGQYWSYNSYPEYSKMLPGFSVRTIRSIVARAVKHGLLTLGNFNRKKYDNTNWYTLTPKAWEYFPREAKKVYPERFAQSGRGGEDLHTPVSSDRPSVNSDRPIPEELNTLGSNINITTNNGVSTKSRSKGLTRPLMQDMIQVYREVFPDNPQPHCKLISTSLQKTLQSLIRRWPEADPEGNQLDISAFRRYLTLLRETAPKFSLGEYLTKEGNKRKNGMETFCRWNTLVQFLENKYS